MYLDVAGTKRMMVTTLCNRWPSHSLRYCRNRKKDANSIANWIVFRCFLQYLLWPEFTHLVTFVECTGTLVPKASRRRVPKRTAQTTSNITTGFYSPVLVFIQKDNNWSMETRRGLRLADRLAQKPSNTKLEVALDRQCRYLDRTLSRVNCKGELGFVSERQRQRGVFDDR